MSRERTLRLFLRWVGAVAALAAFCANSATSARSFQSSRHPLPSLVNMG